MNNFGSQASGSNVTLRLQGVINTLSELEEAIKSGDVDARVLMEFRQAVDTIRGTAWAVQQWIGLKEQSGDPYSVIPILAAQRVLRATQLSQDLVVDLESVDVSIDTPGLHQLYSSVNRLQERLAPLFGNRR
ncbi:MAG TPA: hypothetical protein VLK33_20420 [Terriglobales bacterium]|nr:hypothetical protein [Terriglobales bacterium]